MNILLLIIFIGYGERVTGLTTFSTRWYLILNGLLLKGEKEIMTFHDSPVLIHFKHDIK